MRYLKVLERKKKEYTYSSCIYECLTWKNYFFPLDSFLLNRIVLGSCPLLNRENSDAHGRAHPSRRTSWRKFSLVLLGLPPLLWETKIGHIFWRLLNRRSSKFYFHSAVPSSGLLNHWVERLKLGWLSDPTMSLARKEALRVSNMIIIWSSL